MDPRHFALVAALATAAACEKKPASAPASPELVSKPAAVDVGKLVTPALFANVPAETPYMIAAFEAIPLEYYAKLKRAVGPAFGTAFAQLRTLAADDEGSSRLMSAIEQELDGKWNAKGLESLGFAASPRFALYGLGLAPVVFRIEVRDDKAVLATIERVAQRAGVTLPAVQTQDGRAYWRTQNGTGELSVVVALADKQLVAAFGPVAEVDRNLALILGSQKPPVSMADGKALTDIMVKHRFGPHMVGFIDTRKSITQGMALVGHPASGACTTEIDRLGGRVPRAVLGYSLLTTSVSSGGAVLELAPDLVTQLEGMRTQIPGVTEAVAGKPMLAMAMGIQLDSARKLALEAMTALRRLGETCALPKLVEMAAERTDSLSRPLPPAIASMTGVLMSLRDVTFGSSPMPEKIDADVAVFSTNPKALYELLVTQVPGLGTGGMQADGRVHALPGLGVPLLLHAGVGDRAIVVGIGANGKSLAEAGLRARAAGTSPFMVMSYDYGKFLELQSQVSRLASGPTPLQDMEQKLNEGLAQLFGRAAATFDVGTHGLTFWGTIEMK